MSSNNNILVVIAVVVLVFALGNLFITINKAGKLTGYATDIGTANLSIASAASINFIVDNINWGAGQVNEIPTSATINSEGTVTDGNWTAVSQGLTLQNDGNTNVALTLTTSNVASAFIGGTSPSYKLKVSNSEANSCEFPLNSTNLGTYTEANGTAQPTCRRFDKTDVSDLLEIDVEIVVPEDADSGAKSSTITATGIVFTP